MEQIGYSSVFSTLPAGYWIIFGSILVLLFILMIITGGPAKLKGGKKRVQNGPLGDARFSTDRELNYEYPTIEYDFQKWCRIGRNREEMMQKYCNDNRNSSDEEALDRYTQLSAGLPTEPGILLGNWHEKAQIQNQVGRKGSGHNRSDSGQSWPNYPWYIRMKKVKGTDPITGRKQIRHIPEDIMKYPDAWKGGRVLTRLCTDDVHAMLVASSGAGKSAFFLYPQAVYAMCTGQSFAITDTKGDNARALQKIARECFG